jgi:hypothetical protein
MTSGSNLKRAATENASSIGPAYQVTSPNLQQHPPEEGNDSIGRQIVAQTQNINHPTGMEILMPVFCAVMGERFIWDPDDAGGLSGGAAVSQWKTAPWRLRLLVERVLVPLDPPRTYGFGIGPGIGLKQDNYLSSSRNGFISSHEGVYYGHTSNVFAPNDPAGRRKWCTTTLQPYIEQLDTYGWPEDCHSYSPA